MLLLSLALAFAAPVPKETHKPPQLIHGVWTIHWSGLPYTATLSGDGNFVCVPGAGGNADETAVFPAANLSAPAYTLAHGPKPTSVGFDPAAMAVYAQNAKAGLIVCDAMGAKKMDYILSATPVGDVQQYLVHPEGKKLLVLTPGKLFVVRPADG